MNGLAAESLVKRELLSTGWKMPRLAPPEVLIKSVAKTDPKRLSRVEAGLERQGLYLYNLSSWDVVDTLFGLDLIVKHPRTGEWVGVDVTLQPVDSQKYHSKKAKQQHLAHLYRLLKLDRVVVFNPIEESIDSL